MAVDLNGAAATPGGTPPQPTPFTIGMADGRLTDGSPIGIVHIQLVTGVVTLFMDADWMDRIAQIFAKKASEMRTKPIIASALENLQPPFRGQRPDGS